MIVLPSTPPDADQLALRDHLRTELFPWSSPAGARASWTEEVAAALATVWAEEFDRAVLPTRLYSLMGACACWRLGEQNAAERLLASFCADREIERDALQGLLECGGPSLALCRLMSVNAVRAVRTSLPPVPTLWILDIDKLHPHAPFEMCLLPRVRSVIECISEVWDTGAGAGALGLRSTRRRNGFEGETARYCADVLDRVGADRGWRIRPDVRWAGAGHLSRAGR